MRTSVTSPHKGSDDIKPTDNAQAGGAGLHVRAAAKKCS